MGRFRNMKDLVRQVGGKTEGKSNGRDVLFVGRHFRVREKPSTRETPRTPQG